MKILVFFFVLFVSVTAEAQRQTENIIIITTDGFRWQEVFGGADASLMSRAAGQVGDTAGLRHEFWRDTPEERRRSIALVLGER